MIRILVPLDGSSVAEQALSHARAIARIFPAELILLRVIPGAINDPGVRKDCVDYALQRHQAIAYLFGLAQQLESRKFPVRYLVADGSPAETIVRFMRQEKPDLLVLSRYGRGDAREFAVGGTAHKVVSNAACSVLLLDSEMPADPEQAYGHIVVPIFDGRESDSMVAVATMIAEIQHSSLLLLYVSEEPQLPKSLPASSHSQQLVNEMHRIIRAEAEHRLHGLAAKMPEAINVQTRVVISSDLSLAIESSADEFDCDLLLLHTINSGLASGRRHSSITQSLVQYSRKPLFILHSAGTEGFASNFRSVYLDEHSLEAG